MHDELTQKDIEKMEAEIEHRKLVVRKQALEDVKVARAQGDLSEHLEHTATSARILSTRRQNSSRMKTRAVSDIWRR